MATLVNVRTLIKLFFSAFLFFFLLLIISAVVALPPKSPPLLPLPSPIFHRYTTSHRSRGTPTATATTVKRDNQAAAEPQYQVIHIKNATPFFLDGGGSGGLVEGRRASSIPSSSSGSYNRRHHRAKAGKKKKKRIMKAASGKNNEVIVKRAARRPFSVMLPKGFVPPSGSSSPCHNDKPDVQSAKAKAKAKATTTATLYSCRLSSSAAKP